MKRSLILKLASAIVLQVSAQCVASPLPIRVIALRPDDVTTIIAERGELAGDLQSAIAVSGFDSPQESVTWSVDAPQENDYAVRQCHEITYRRRRL
jgi:hypothetical protein